MINIKETSTSTKIYIQRNITDDVFVDDNFIDDNYVTNDELKEVIKTKQDLLVSGKNIKTVNGVDILGSGNVEIKVKSDVDLSPYVTKSELNSKGYLTKVPAEYITESELNAMGYITSIPTEYVTETELENKGYLKSVPSEYITETELQNKGYITAIPAEYVTETELQNKGYITSIPSEYVTETELTNKSYATTKQVSNALTNKVDKVSGKGLSTEDFTTSLKVKLESLENYDDTIISNEIADKQDKLVDGESIKTINGNNILGSGNIEIKGNNIEEIPLSRYEFLLENDLIDDETIYIIPDAQLDTNLKTVNGQRLIGTGNIEIPTTDLSNYLTTDEINENFVSYRYANTNLATMRYVSEQITTALGDVESLLNTIITGK